MLTFIMLSVAALFVYTLHLFQTFSLAYLLGTLVDFLHVLFKVGSSDLITIKHTAFLVHFKRLSLGTYKEWSFMAG